MRAAQGHLSSACKRGEEQEQHKRSTRGAQEEHKRAPGLHLACAWLWSGLQVASGSFASPFYILHSAFCLRFRAGVKPALGRRTFLSRQPKGLPDGSRKSPGCYLWPATFSKLQAQARRPPYFFKPECVPAATASDNDGERRASSRRPALWRAGIGAIAFG